MMLNIICSNVRGDKEKRRMVDLLLRKWNSNIVCLTETKMNVIDLPCIKRVGGSRWTDWAELEAQGSSGGILVYWDKRRWQCMDKLVGQHSVTVILEEGSSGLQYAFTGVYGPCDRKERKTFMERAGRCSQNCNSALGNWG